MNFWANILQTHFSFCRSSTVDTDYSNSLHRFLLVSSSSQCCLMLIGIWFRQETSAPSKVSELSGIAIRNHLINDCISRLLREKMFCRQLPSRDFCLWHGIETNKKQPMNEPTYTFIVCLVLCSYSIIVQRVILGAYCQRRISCHSSAVVACTKWKHWTRITKLTVNRNTNRDKVKLREKVSICFLQSGSGSTEVNGLNSKDNTFYEVIKQS